MGKTFKGRPVIAGDITAEAVVTRQGFNTLASFQKSALMKKKEVICSDQNNADLYGKNLTGKCSVCRRLSGRQRAVWCCIR